MTTADESEVEDMLERMQQEAELKPCPFCGSAPVWLPVDRLGSKDQNVACMNHGCFGPCTTASGEDAVEQWNKRA